MGISSHYKSENMVWRFSVCSHWHRVIWGLEVMKPLSGFLRFAGTRTVGDPVNRVFKITPFSSIPWPIWSSGGHEERFIWGSVSVFFCFLGGGHVEQFWPGQECPLFDVVHPALPRRRAPFKVPCMMVLESRCAWHNPITPFNSLMPTSFGSHHLSILC